ncbi:MAG: hypothetical protein WAW88_02200 [Nocardioides sp.]
MGTHEAVELESLWRAAVLELREGERRHRFPCSIQIGTPGQAWGSVLDGGALDSDQRVEVVVGLLDRLGGSQPTPALAWLTRAGELCTHDADLAWLAATMQARAELGISLPFVVVTRRGWYDPVHGNKREWRRLRRR